MSGNSKRNPNGIVSFAIEDDEDSLEDEEEFEDEEEKKYSVGLSNIFYIVGLLSLALVYILLVILVLMGSTISKGLIHFMIDQISTNSRKIDFCNKDQMIPDTNRKYYVDWTRGTHNTNTRPDDENLVPIEGTDQASLLETEQVAWLWCLFFSFAIPEGIVFLQSLKEILLNESMVLQQRVSYKMQFGVVFLLEMVHTLGLGLLFFVGLPQVDTIQAIAITSCISIFPFLLSTINKYGTCKKVSKYKFLIFDVLAIAIQLSGIFIWPFVTDGSNPLSLSFGLFLTSFAWWESYVSADKTNLRPVQFLVEIKQAMNNNTRYWIYMVISLFKIGMFLALMVLLSASNGLVSDPLHLFTKFEESFSVHYYKVREALPPLIGSETVFEREYMALFATSKYFPLWVLLVQMGCSLLTYGISIFVCKIRLEQLIFAFPLSLTMPLLLNTVFIMCGQQLEDPCATFFPKYASFQCPPLNDSFAYIWDNLLWLWLLWFASQIWITRHIWNSASIRLASIEQLFCKPLYLGLMVDQSLVLNKRNDAFAAESSEERVTIIYGCVTLWHETQTEMQSLIRSLLRMDHYHNTQKFISQHKKGGKRDYYEWETHIIFDDAFHYPGSDGSQEKDDNIVGEVGTINTFVHNLMDILDKECDLPIIRPMPYGGQIEWTLPMGTNIICHLKDKFKIKNKKRWSQIMYMNYLLKFKHKELTNRGNYNLENTYLLALDGDMDFRPEAVTMLLDLMKKNIKTGAVCGRIHPLGSGLMKWYQSFEYAIGHWLQKSTEHVIGCVLCSPGCFSLFRASCIHGGIMKTYATVSTSPKDFVQYDQGEDRWLCTLLLQNGYRVAYAAACDAYTFVPETFDDFFKQRRRWMPSTMANIVDLLSDYKSVVHKNIDISYFYIAYQLMLLVGTILGPGTIFLMLVGSVSVAFKLSNINSFLFNIIPIFAYMIVCYSYSSNDKVQLMIAQILSFFYTMVMMAVLVGIMLQISEDGWLAPTTLSLLLVATSFIVSAVAHPKEILCLPCGLIYYVTIPAMYLLLVIYSIFNLNVISWGTREVNTGADSKESSKTSLKDAVVMFITNFFKRETEKTQEVPGPSIASTSRSVSPDPLKEIRSMQRRMSLRVREEEFDDEDEEEEETRKEYDYFKNPYWLDSKDLQKKEVEFTSSEETSFWKDLIKTYLTPDLSRETILRERDQPMKKNEDNALEKKQGLEALRNQVVLTFIIINSLFVVTVFLLQQQKDIIHINWPLDAMPNITFIRYQQNSVAIDISYEYLTLEPIGLVFIVFFASVLIVQLIGMFAHRLLTLMHILSMKPIKKFIHGDLSFINKVNKHMRHTKRKISETEVDEEELKAKEQKRNEVFMRRLSMHPQFHA